MLTDIEGILKKLDIKERGYYDDSFYVIQLKDSDDYARMYSHLDKVAINTENPSIGKNTSNNTVKITNYFEFEFENVLHDIFLIADFNEDTYLLKIGEKKEEN